MIKSSPKQKKVKSSVAGSSQEVKRINFKKVKPVEVVMSPDELLSSGRERRTSSIIKPRRIVNSN